MNDLVNKFVAALGIGALLLWVHTPSAAKLNEEVWLITPEEAGMAPAEEVPGGGEFKIGSEEMDLGPKIEVLKPTNGGSAPPPVEVLIKFLPNPKAVDLASLIVSVVKLFTIDITDRVRDHATADGIHVQQAKIPAGKHKVRISIADIDGLRSVKDVTFEVL